MKDTELKDTLKSRRDALGLSLRNIQSHTGLGYNTVRRVFADPFKCRLHSVVSILSMLGCELVFSIGNSIGDELEPEEENEDGKHE